MNPEDEQIMRELHLEFMQSLDAFYILGYFYQHNVISLEEYQRLRNTQPESERTCQLLLILPKVLRNTDLFHDALENSGYPFLAERIRECKIKHGNNIYRQRKSCVFGNNRIHLVNFRHKLKRLAHFGQHVDFKKEVKLIRSRWQTVVVNGFRSIDKEEKQNLADHYFYALDAICERKRLIFDKTLVKSKVFQTIRELTKHTSEANIPNMLCSARYGSAIFMANENDFEEAHQYIKEAKQKFDLVKKCRETGIVLYIEYNMFHRRYSKTMNYCQKEHLLTLGNQAIEHFNEERETNPDVSNDFLRMFGLKLCHLYLGIGLFGNYLDTTVTNQDISHAKYILQTTEGEMWGRMETRWKWFYFTAKARLLYLGNNIREALVYARLALECAVTCNNTNEIEFTRTTIKHIEMKIR